MCPHLIKYDEFWINVDVYFEILKFSGIKD